MLFILYLVSFVSFIACQFTSTTTPTSSSSSSPSPSSLKNFTYQQLNKTNLNNVSTMPHKSLNRTISYSFKFHNSNSSNGNGTTGTRNASNYPSNPAQYIILESNATGADIEGNYSEYSGSNVTIQETTSMINNKSKCSFELKNIEKIRKVSIECERLTGVSNITAILEMQSYGNDQCFSKCLMEKLNLLNKSGTIKQTGVIYVFKTNENFKSKIHEQQSTIWKNCVAKIEKESNGMNYSCGFHAKFLTCGLQGISQNCTLLNINPREI